jgi:hypothetical protein
MAWFVDAGGRAKERRRARQEQHPLARGLEREPVDLGPSALVDAKPAKLKDGRHGSRS